MNRFGMNEGSRYDASLVLDPEPGCRVPLLTQAYLHYWDKGQRVPADLAARLIEEGHDVEARGCQVGVVRRVSCPLSASITYQACRVGNALELFGASWPLDSSGGDEWFRWWNYRAAQKANLTDIRSAENRPYHMFFAVCTNRNFVVIVSPATPISHPEEGKRYAD